MNLSDEGDRQLVLMALAHLSVERPGFDDALNRIALKIDNNNEGRAEMFDGFRDLHRRALVAERSRLLAGRRGVRACGAPFEGKLCELDLGHLGAHDVLERVRRTVKP